MAEVHRLEGDDCIRSAISDGDGRLRTMTQQDRTSVLKEYRNWLPDAENDDLSVDETGLWLEMTSTGKKKWSSWAKLEMQPAWTIDDMCQSKEVVVRAVDMETAQKALADWRSLYPHNVIESSLTTHLDHYVTRSGVVIDGGVELRAKYIQND